MKQHIPSEAPPSRPDDICRCRSRYASPGRICDRSAKNYWHLRGVFGALDPVSTTVLGLITYQADFIH